MKDQLAALYELQTLDVKIAKIKAAIQALEGAKALKEMIGAAKTRAQAVGVRLTELETDLTDSELQLKSIDEKRSSVEKRLYGGVVSNPRELQALEKEVQILKGRQGKLDGRTLELYDQRESLRAEVKAAEAEVAELDKQIAESLERESTDRARFESELAEATAERERAVATVTDRALMARYEAVRKKTGTTGIAKVIGGKCEGCKIAITGFTQRKLSEDGEFELCESCGRILMLDMG